MDKNYINIVRRSLNSSQEKTQTRSNKIVFAPCDYNSETVFFNLEEKQPKHEWKRERNRTEQKKKNKLQKRKKIVFTSCDNKSNAVFVDVEEKQLNFERDKTEQGNKLLKKLKKIETFIPSDINSGWKSVEELSEIIDGTFLTPSRSEMIDEDDDITTYNHNEEVDDNFEWDEFSDSREQIMNESFIEAHSGIYEVFRTNKVRRIKIKRCIVESNDKTVQKSDLYSLIPINTYGNLDTELSNQSNVNIYSKSTEKISDTSEEYHLSLSSQCHTDLIENSQSSCNDGDALTNEIDYPTDNLDKSENYIDKSVNGTNPLAEDVNSPRNKSCIDTNAQYFDFDNMKAVLLKENKSVPVYGCFLIKILKGEVNIFGTILRKSNALTKISSPRGFSMLTIKNITSGDEETYATLLKDIHEFPNSNERMSKTVVLKNDAVFLCYKLEEEYLKFIQQYISQQIFPNNHNEDLPQVIFEPKDNMNSTSNNANWDNIAEMVNFRTKLFISGGKGVGKSTFLRYMINKVLTKFDQIRIIDLDPGQSEFFMPGCISVLTVSEPVLGPNFTHLKNPERSYLCDIGTASPACYVKNVKALMEYVSHLNQMPTLINYMGFSKGLGIKIVSSVITIVRPTDIVQIESRQNNKNFICDLNLASIRKHCDYFGGNYNGLNYRLHKIKSQTDKMTGWKFEPRQARELCTLAYLGQWMKDGASSLTDYRLPMYEVKLSSVKLRDLRHNEILPAAINANLVAMCNVDEMYENFICLAFGVVRGIDLENDYLVLITNVSPEILDDISHLVLTGVSLPPSIYMTPQNIRGLMPYVMEGELTSLAQLTKRSYIPAAQFTK